MADNYIRNVAVVGAGGHTGRFIAEALIANSKHDVTALTRSESSSSLPAGLYAVKTVDYADHESLVQSLADQDALVITMSVMAPKESQTQLIDAAVEAGVRYIIPNELVVDMEKIEVSQQVFMRDRVLLIREYIERTGAGKTHWIGICPGIFYEFSLAAPERFGLDFETRTMTFYDDGKTKVTASTWPQIGRAVSALLSLPIESEIGTFLSRFNNRSIHISSFHVSQREIFESALRVRGEREADWTINSEKAVDRYQRGQQMMGKGDFSGYPILLYARLFYPDKACDQSDKLDNNILGLQQDELDDATRVGIKMAEAKETRH